MPAFSITVSAQSPAGYVHADERALVLHDGQRTVIFDRSRLKWIRETLGILLDEQRATRNQQDHILGGYQQGVDGFVLYAATPTGALSVAVSRTDVEALRDALHPRSV